VFRALLCPSSGACDYNIDYHIGRFFCKDGRGSVNVKLRFLVVCVRCEVLCPLVVAGNVCLNFNRCDLLCVLIVVFCCVWCILFVDWLM